MPKTFAFNVSATINAPIKEVFDVMNDLGQLNAWSPFVAMDKTVTSTVSSPAKGVGAVYAWDGKRIGKGTMTITNSTTPNRIAMDMVFLNNKTTTALSEYLLSEKEGATVVTWAMSGERGLGMWLMATVLGMDNMMKKNFADGLSSLKKLVESKKK
ncbi:MAG: hypothetical protein RIR88_553 [Actinomycetota bacterium]